MSISSYFNLQNNPLLLNNKKRQFILTRRQRSSVLNIKNGGYFLSAGDIIRLDALSWSIQSVVPSVGYTDITVAPALQSSLIGLQTFSFEAVVPTPITYAEDIDYWLSDPNIQGFISSSARRLIW